MQYMVPETYTVKRGRMLEALNIIVMETVHHEIVVGGLDKYFSFERGVHVNPDEQTSSLINKINEETIASRR